MLTVLTRLAMLTGDTEYMGRASTLAATFGNEANRMLNGAGSYLAGFEYLLNSLIIMVIGHKGKALAADRGLKKTAALLPDKLQLVGYVNVKEIASMMPARPSAPAFPDAPPLAYALRVDIRFQPGKVNGFNGFLGMLGRTVLVLVPLLYSFYGDRTPPEGAGDLSH